MTRFIREQIDRLQRSVEFFSPQAKQERELWVARAFLSYLGLGAKANELQPSKHEPPDLLFREARFEIKEVLDDNRKRGKEYKDALAKARRATTAQELLAHYEPKTITLEEAAALANDTVADLKDKYAPSVARDLDLLIYLNLNDCSVAGAEPPIPNHTDLETWRSISVVGNDCAFVLATSAGAPPFLSAAEGQVFRK